VYYSVGCYFEVDILEARKYALKLQYGVASWDEEPKAELLIWLATEKYLSKFILASI
jgi:hypothetical protein